MNGVTINTQAFSEYSAVFESDNFSVPAGPVSSRQVVEIGNLLTFTDSKRQLDKAY